MFKRVGSIVLTVLMLISMLCTVTVASAETVGLPELVLTADKATVKHGDTVTITVAMKNAVDMATIQINLPYNTTLFAYADNHAAKTDGTLTEVNEDGGFIHIAWTAAENMVPTDLVELQFTVTGAVKAGTWEQAGAVIGEFGYAKIGEGDSVENGYFEAGSYVAKSNSLSFTVDCTTTYKISAPATAGTATNAKHTVKCSKCGHEKEVTCSFGDPVRIAPDTCDAIGTDQITCACGYSIDTAVDVIQGHNWSADWYQDAENQKHYKKCLNPGCEAKKDETACSGWTWNNVATEDGSKHICGTCGLQVACEWQEYANTVPATCTEDEYSTKKCKATGCSGHYVIVNTGSATGHQYDNACDTTCNNDCDHVRPIEHTYTNACDADCNVCGKPRTVTHTYTNACDASCNVCGDTRNAGHSFGAYVYNNDANTTKDGTKTRTCSVCGEKETVTASGTKLNNPFVDVKDGEFYTTPVIWAVEKGITTGTSATTFSPNDLCTRGQVVTFLWRAAGSPEPTSNGNPFKDVKSGDYYYKAVLWAVEKGITNGVSATEFAPNDTCTRGQVVTFLWRAEGKPAVNTSVSFTDVKADQYYATAVAWAVKNGITNGMSATTFEPNTKCTRGQIVTFLYRAYK